MKKILTLSLMLFFAWSVFAESPDKIKGYWLTENGTSQIYIYKAKNGSYYGKIVWMDEPNEDGAPKKDKENPDPELRKRPLQNLLILKSFEYDPDEENWSGGTIYDPESGKTYDAYMWFEDGNYDQLKLKGYVLGMKFLGRETEWKRESEERKN